MTHISSGAAIRNRKFLLFMYVRIHIHTHSEYMHVCLSCIWYGICCRSTDSWLFLHINFFFLCCLLHLFYLMTILFKINFDVIMHVVGVDFRSTFCQIRSNSRWQQFLSTAFTSASNTRKQMVTYSDGPWQQAIIPRTLYMIICTILLIEHVEEHLDFLLRSRTIDCLYRHCDFNITWQYIVIVNNTGTLITICSILEAIRFQDADDRWSINSLHMCIKIISG